MQFSVSIDTNGFSSPFEPPPYTEREAPRGHEAMKWLNFRELVCERSEARCVKDWAGTVEKTLERFTDYCKLADRNLDEVTSVDLERYVAKRKKDATWRGPISPKTINNEVVILNGIFEYAGPKHHKGKGRRNLGLIATPPYADLLTEDDNDPVAVTEEQKEYLLKAIQNATTPRWKDVEPAYFWLSAIVIGTVTALRRGAILNVLRPSDAILRKRVLDVPAKLMKTRRQHKIPLSKKVVEYIEKLETKPGERLLPWYGPDGTPNSLGHFTDTFKQIQRDAGVPEELRVKFKDLRSTAATELLERFGDSTAKKRLAHAAKSTTIDTNYKARRPGETDFDASDYLSDVFVPQVQQLRLFQDVPQEEAS